MLYHTIVVRHDGTVATKYHTRNQDAFDHWQAACRDDATLYAGYFDEREPVNQWMRQL